MLLPPILFSTVDQQNSTLPSTQYRKANRRYTHQVVYHEPCTLPLLTVGPAPTPTLESSSGRVLPLPLPLCSDSADVKLSAGGRTETPARAAQHSTVRGAPEMEMAGHNSVSYVRSSTRNLQTDQEIYIAECAAVPLATMRS